MWRHFKFQVFYCCFNLTLQLCHCIDCDGWKLKLIKGRVTKDYKVNKFSIRSRVKQKENFGFGYNKYQGWNSIIYIHKVLISIVLTLNVKMFRINKNLFLCLKNVQNAVTCQTTNQDSPFLHGSLPTNGVMHQQT